MPEAPGCGVVLMGIWCLQFSHSSTTWRLPVSSLSINCEQFSNGRYKTSSSSQELLLPGTCTLIPIVCIFESIIQVMARKHRKLPSPRQHRASHHRYHCHIAAQQGGVLVPRRLSSCQIACFSHYLPHHFCSVS